MAYIEWSRAYTGRVRRAHCDALKSRAGELSRRLARELDGGSLPFLKMGYVDPLKRELPGVAARAKEFHNMLVLGIGGSALGARAMQRAFAPAQDMPGGSGPDGRSLWIADNVDPYTLPEWFRRLDPRDTMVVTISKSGGTIETISQYFLACDWLKKALCEDWKKHMIVVTDLKKGFLREEAGKFGFPSLEVPDNLGGRYSALSAVGLLPAAFLGIDWESLLDGAASVARPLAEHPESLAGHPSFALACWARALEEYDYTQLIFFCYEPLFATYGPWFGQLWAESLGPPQVLRISTPLTRCFWMESATRAASLSLEIPPQRDPYSAVTSPRSGNSFPGCISGNCSKLRPWVPVWLFAAMTRRLCISLSMTPANYPAAA